MSGCPALIGGEGGAALSAALRSVDCQTGEATAFAFGRLFGADGRLLPALTLLLTLYVAFFAIGLLTGRTRVGIGTLTPRMMTLGLVLTFATSWAAYQNVVWTLATGAPDQIAGVLTGARGSATTAFADRLDGLFTIVSDAADAASRPAAPSATGITPATPMAGGFTAATVLSLSSVMLMLGTVGVLVTSKIALAAMLALGPVFITLALFGPTRGLFEGWLKAVVLFAVTPLLAVLIGGGAVIALAPVARAVAMEGAEPSSRLVGVLFLGAAVYLALMVMALRTATTLVGGWRLPGTARERGDDRAQTGTQIAAVSPAASSSAIVSSSTHADDRVRALVTGLRSSDPAGAIVAAGPVSSQHRSAQVISINGTPAPTIATDMRVHGVGARFRPRALPAPAIGKGRLA
ncbi:type IV secretion system protein [Sphingomonas nostoxanthinifaciens]|uniref:type IV secretion system protein n=1 Tax=Sphingomonas nostoxanthinifaciens TaxID=2872652 RepID=UPI001CC1C4EC|nr:type IV secretion system protein [Sphingomonas nostoxanthinifaciens]UAK23165.1 type IV secretion system protein [Sphingomonas nostoxanthinifaciens]